VFNTKVLLECDAMRMKIMIIEDENYWQSELRSLGIECKRKNELNDREELQALATAIKEVYFQDYKTAYNNDSHRRSDKLRFELHHY
jgi:hypothetical protein